MTTVKTTFKPGDEVTTPAGPGQFVRWLQPAQISALVLEETSGEEHVHLYSNIAPR